MIRLTGSDPGFQDRTLAGQATQIPCTSRPALEILKRLSSASAQTKTVSFRDLSGSKYPMHVNFLSSDTKVSLKNPRRALIFHP